MTEREALIVDIHEDMLAALRLAAEICDMEKSISQMDFEAGRAAILAAIAKAERIP